MDSIIQKIRTAYDSMGPAEKRIAEYIIEHTDEIVGMSISELSARCECGDATLVRFSRRLQLDGFGMLKIKLAGELSQSSALGSDIKESDDPFVLYQKRVLDITASLDNTATVLDPNELLRASETILNADRIVTFGLGSSSPIAQDAAHKFSRLGLVAQSCTDNHMQALVACHLKRGNVALGISHSGASKDIIEVLGVSRACGATTICITNFGKPPILDVSDIVLFTKSEETKRSVLAMSSRIAQLAILDSIYTYIVLNSKNKAQREIFNTEYVLQSKKV